MFIGELEFSDLPIDSSDTLAFFNFTFLILFVFITIVVLMNLLNGLAVSDVGELLAEAEIISIKSRAKTITFMQKRRSQIQMDSLEPYEELVYLEGSQASGSRMERIRTWWLKRRSESKAKKEDLPDSIKSPAREIALQRVALKTEEKRADEEEKKRKLKEKEGE